MQRLGQHFLINQSALRAIARAVDPRTGDTIVEIGPGHGELTELLGFDGSGGHIVAIEKDARLAEELEKKFADMPFVEIIEGDALKLLPQLTKSYKLSRSAGSREARQTARWKLVGNIPYYITGHLLRIISELEHKPDRVVFTIQHEVAKRIVARPPKMNRLAAAMQFWGTPKILQTLRSADFRPTPGVESAVLEIVHLDATHRMSVEPADYYRTVRLLFQQPRKTIFNNLRAGKISADAASTILTKAGIPERARPQDLSLSDIVHITKLLSSSRADGELCTAQIAT